MRCHFYFKLDEWFLLRNHVTQYAAGIMRSKSAYVYLLLRTIVSNMQNVANVAGNINSLHSVISQTDFHLIVSLFSG